MAAIRYLEVAPHCRLVVGGLGEAASLILILSITMLRIEETSTFLRLLLLSVSFYIPSVIP